MIRHVDNEGYFKPSWTSKTFGNLSAQVTGQVKEQWMKGSERASTGLMKALSCRLDPVHLCVDEFEPIHVSRIATQRQEALLILPAVAVAVPDWDLIA